MSSRIVTLAKAVAEHLSNGSFSTPITARYEPVPRMDLQNVRDIEVFVTPDASPRERLDRNAWLVTQVVQVGVLKHINKSNRWNEIDDLTQLMDEISDALSFEELTEYPEAKLLQFDKTPLYFYQHIHQYSVFSGILTVHYQIGLKP